MKQSVSLMNLSLPDGFPHKPPKITPTKSHNIGEMFLLFGYGITVVILILMMMLGLSGILQHKTGTYSSPINSTKCGDPVDISDTRDYTAMQLNLNPLEYVLYS